MQRILDVRIVRWYLKLAYAAGVWVVGYVVQRLLELLPLPDVALYVLGLVVTLSGIVLGARIFRGRDEPLVTRRPWWKMTARRPLSWVLGILALLGATVSVAAPVLGTGGSTLSPPITAINSGWYLVIAFLYLNSGARHERQIPAPPAQVVPDRQSTRAIVLEVLQVLNQYDLSGVRPGAEDGAPIDEYENEALPIAGVLLRRRSVGRSDISAVWLKWFSDDLSHLSDETWTELLKDLNAIIGARQA